MLHSQQGTKTSAETSVYDYPDENWCAAFHVVKPMRSYGRLDVIYKDNSKIYPK